jgi:hypothetical protein
MNQMTSTRSWSRLRLVALCSTALLTATACAGGDTGGGEPDSEPPAANTIDTLVDAYLAGFERCTADWFVRDLEEDADLLGIDREALRDSLDRSEHPNYGDLNQQALDDCVAFMEGDGLCELVSGGGELDPSCNDIFPGLVEDGGGCFQSDECVDGLVCRQGDSICGTCVPALDIGDACGENVAGGCDENEGYCDGEVCVAYEVEDPEPTFNAGDTCDAENEGCGNVVVNGLKCIDGACADLEIVGEGDECDLVSPFQPGPGTRVCRDSFTIRALVCDAPFDGSAPGTCVPTPAVGEDCIQGAFCGAAAICEAGVCVEAPPECTTDADCFSDATCNEGACVSVDPICGE